MHFARMTSTLSFEYSYTLEPARHSSIRIVYLEGGLEEGHAVAAVAALAQLLALQGQLQAGVVVASAAAVLARARPVSIHGGGDAGREIEKLLVKIRNDPQCFQFRFRFQIVRTPQSVKVKNSNFSKCRVRSYTIGKPLQMHD